jgi:hypothetical protein
MGEHVARMGAMRNTCNIYLESLKVRDHSKDLGVDERIILKCVLLVKWGWRSWIGFIWLRLVFLLPFSLRDGLGTSDSNTHTYRYIYIYIYTSRLIV